MQNYVSLIIDIEKSKTYGIEIRNVIQQYMVYCADCLNEIFANRIQYAVTFSAGDELQGLFLDVTTAVLYFRLLEILMHPVKVRAGVGVGAWTVKIENGLSTQQDGPAYHSARRAIIDVHAMQLHNMRIYSDRDDILTNCLVNASYTLKQQQNYMQNFTLIILELLYPFMSIRGEISRNYAIVLRKLLCGKFEYGLRFKRDHFTSKASGSLLESAYFDAYHMQPVDVMMIDGSLIEAESVIRRKNMALAISDVLRCTRQNADSLMKRGNANKIRELDYVALQYIERIYGG